MKHDIFLVHQMLIGPVQLVLLAFSILSVLLKKETCDLMLKCIVS